jgi:cytochrome P450
MTDQRTAPLPPGDTGLPLIGETLSFVKNMFGFMSERFDKHGPVFRSHILGNSAVFIHGKDITDVWLDDTCVQRETSFPNHMEALFGGRSLPLLDGATHKTRKRLVLSAFKRDAFASYLPKLETAIDDSFARVATGKTVRWLDELKVLSVDGILRTIFGMAPGPEMEAMVADYGLITRGFTGIPINLPGFHLRAGLQARDRIFERLRAAIDAHIAKPSDDGLSRLLAAEADGVKFEKEQLVLELHHVMIAGLIIFAELACTVTTLTDHPDIRAKLEEEVNRVVGRGSLTLEKLDAMPYLEQMMLETKRACPNVPVSSGRAKKDFELGGYTIKQGTLIFMSVYANNLDAGSFAEPAKFDPERFGAARAEHLKHKHAYQPQGAGVDLDHRCAGVDFSSIFMKAFTAHLVRDFEWTLPEQSLDFRWDIVPPEQKDGLLAVVARRAGGAQ